MARAEIYRDPSLDGDGMALAGLIIAYGLLALIILFVALICVLHVGTAVTTTTTYSIS